ncbi:cell wall hydrolase [Fuchsiella alkaliacetigena]|uniref:cell wall hydrolase n=1 Tax=Fuchsiella alkaliacetigena TaxID=957042 RepID=UPI00200B093A|nr:cell wall hydrolase [Fuchsiella alkaliacetigena]MCK8823881.1 cell wall hydrolase [Fuchsiella alkaliacetigena]
MKKRGKIFLVLLLTVTMLFTNYMLAQAATTHTVRAGESLWGIAQRYNTTVNQLKSTNNHWSDTIFVGDTLTVPGNAQTYTVQRGDTLQAVANRFNISLSQLRSSNGIWTDMIRVGDVLTIPNSTTQTNSQQATGSYSSQDLDLLARLIYGEARGESYEGQVAVGAVILNRVESPDFPNTVRGVVYQSLAFEAIMDGQAYMRPNEQAYKAARAALNGWDPSGNALYFYNPSGVHSPTNWIWTRTVIRTIGNHHFAV